MKIINFNLIRQGCLNRGLLCLIGSFLKVSFLKSNRLKSVITLNNKYIVENAYLIQIKERIWTLRNYFINNINVIVE